MLAIKTVLAPVDFSPETGLELELALEVCRAFGARLVLHHNEEAAPLGFSRAWDWKETHADRPHDERELLEKLLARLPDDVSREAVMTRGTLVPALLRLAEAQEADLLVIATHGWSIEEHASVAERLIRRSPCPVLTIDTCGEKATPFRLTGDEGLEVLVPTDFSEEGTRACEYAFELARALPSVSVHLLHVVPPGHLGPGVVAEVAGGGGRRLAAVEAAYERLADLPPADLADRVGFSVEVGDAADEIADFTTRLEPDVVIMGEHARGMLRRYLTRDTAKQLLHRAVCPVWYVPGLVELEGKPEPELESSNPVS